ncbi:MAG: cell division protein FtsL [Burkholderiaceae bacterium]
MSRHWFLAAVLVVSALALVNARYHERRLFAQIERAESQSQKRASDIETLRVGLTSRGAPARLDGLVKSKLGLEPIRPGQTLVYRAPEPRP